MTDNSNFEQVENEKNEKGASLVEYTLLVALIAIAAIVAVRTLGDAVSESFSEVASEFQGNVN